MWHIVIVCRFCLVPAILQQWQNYWLIKETMEKDWSSTETKEGRANHVACSTNFTLITGALPLDQQLVCWWYFDMHSTGSRVL